MRVHTLDNLDEKYRKTGRTETIRTWRRYEGTKTEDIKGRSLCG